MTTAAGSRRRLGAAAALLVAAMSVAAPAGAAGAPSGISFSPSAGPVGTVVTISGHLGQSDHKTFRNVDTVTAYITAGHPHAGLELSLPGQLTITHDGSMRLTVTVPLHADWRANPMSGSSDRLSQTPAPTVLELAWPCRACGLGTFQVTAASSLPFTGGPGRLPVVLAVVLLVTGGAALTVGRRRA